MTTWWEARQAKERRLQRERRYYTTELRGPKCPVCKGWTDPTVAEAAGYPTHPTCEPGYLDLLRRTGQS